MKTYLLGLMASCCLPLLSLASSLEDSVLSGLSPRLERAYLQRRDDATAVELAKLEALLSEQPQHPRALYYKAYILLNRATLLNPALSKDQRRAAYDVAEKAISAALKAEHSPEALSLHAACLERSLEVRSGLAMMTLGPKAGGEHEEALQAAPQSPRVLLMQGMSLYHKPAFVGGSVEKALVVFRQAAEAAAAEPDASTAAQGYAPTWGEAEAYAWIGQAEARLGQIDRAREAYAKALALEPEFGWVKNILLPALDQPVK